MDFLTLDREAFDYGRVDRVAPRVRRVIAENPSKFTYHGTGTYIIGDGDVAVIDPGPMLDAHRDALVAALRGETVRAILVTHCHADHSPLAAWLRAETGASTFAFGPHGDDRWDIGTDPEGFGVAPGAPTEGAEVTTREEPQGEVKVEESVDRDFAPDVTVSTGDTVVETAEWSVQALHTPGHTSNHTCFVLDDGTGTTLFTGDHVMGWSTTVVSPPDGDMAAYIESLRVVAGRHDDLGIPTHGPPIPHPAAFVQRLVEHRLEREAHVLAAVRAGLSSVQDVVTRLYADVRIELHKPAARSVLAHLVKLVDDGLVEHRGEHDRPRLDSTYLPV